MTAGPRSHHKQLYYYYYYNNRVYLMLLHFGTFLHLSLKTVLKKTEALPIRRDAAELRCLQSRGAAAHGPLCETCPQIKPYPIQRPTSLYFLPSPNRQTGFAMCSEGQAAENGEAARVPHTPLS